MPGALDSDPGLPRRTGILGGSFDPPHVGHAIVAQDLFERLRLDRLLVIPAGDPPHREVVLPAETRLDLVRRLFAGADGIEVSGMEVERPGPSYTIDTLEGLSRRLPSDRLVLIMGADQLAVIDTWKDYRRLGELAEVVVMHRKGREPAPPPGVPEIDYIVADVPRIDVSASEVRQRLEDGRSIRFLVPESIRADIERAWAEQSRRDPVTQ